MKDFVILTNCLLVRFSIDTKGPSGKVTGFCSVRGSFINMRRLRSEIFNKFIDGQFTSNGIDSEDVVIECIIASPIYEEGGKSC